jgi:hypothetical protein
MSSLITKNFRTLLAKQLFNLLDIAANSYLPATRKSYVYAFIGKQLRWNDGTEVPAVPGESITDINDYYKKGILAKQISIENASFVVDRNDWTANTIYNTYEANTNFYVLNSKDQVFKCLANTANVASTNEPELTLSTTSLEEPFISTGDGYKWKYMYTLTSTQKQKYLSDDWMPVSTNRFVTAAAEAGSIDIVSVTNAGNNYTDGTTQAIISVDGDGVNAVLRANVSGGQIQDVVIQNRGNFYTYADLTFTDVAGGTGAGASAVVSIAPRDGHGFDPESELNATTLMFNVEFEENEAGVLPTDNDFREIVLIQNPTTSAGSQATGSVYTLYKNIKVSPGVGDYTADEVVFQGSTFGEATFTADVISFDIVENKLFVNNARGTLATNSAIKGFNSGAIRIVNNVTEPTMQLYSGKILYISDKLPITRDPSQTERIRFILSF